MALTEEIIKANEALATLSPDQIAAITTLSTNDEAAVIGTKLGKQHELLEADVKAISGFDKKDGEKSYEYNKRVLQHYKEQATATTELQTTIESQKQAITDLKAQIASGSNDAAIKQQLKDAQSELQASKNLLTEREQAWTTEKTTFSKTMSDFKVKAELKTVTTGLKFKAAYPESVQKTLLSSAESELLSKYNPDWIDDGQGNATLVFRNKDAQGEIVRNKANGLQPYTASELLKESLKDTLELGSKKPGGGTKPPTDTPTTVDLGEIGSAKTQVDADALIVKHLMSIGITRGSEKFAEEQQKIRTENNVSALPVR